MTMLELEEKMDNAANECSDRLWNKKWDPGQDMLRAAFLEGVKWLARELMKGQENGRIKELGNRPINILE